MKLTAAHVHFWRSKKAPLCPRFAARVRMPAAPTIHELVNLQGGVVPETAKGNTISILRVARKRGAVREVLENLQFSTDKRRAADAFKWLQKLQGERNGTQAK